MKLNKRLLIFPYIIIIIISIFFLIRIHSYWPYTLLSLLGYVRSVKMIHEMLAMLVYGIKNLLLGLISSIAIIGIIKYFNKDII
jgi:hypothetical protein